MSPVSIVSWPNVRDVANQLSVSAVYVNYLIHAGKLTAVRTRLGFLVDPDSASDFEAKRKARMRKVSA